MPTRVLLLRDGNWPAVPGVCCWRRGFRRAFAAAGARVAEVATVPAGGSGVAGRAGWLPAPVRRRLALPRPSVARRAAAELAAADLVVAESPAAAGAAARSGVPPSRLWLLALPRTRLFAGEPSGYAAALAAAAAHTGGLLADAEPARESVERATADHRRRVLLFPPVAGECSGCAGRVLPPPDPGTPEPVARLAQLARGRALVGTDGQVAAARALLAAVAPVPAPRARPARSVLVSGYDLKFAGELARELDRRTDLAVTVDPWPELGTPGRRTRARLRAADAVLAEWARTSAVWLSRRTRPGQLLVMRLHRFELDSPYPRQLDIDRLDAVVYIAPLFGRRIRDELGWPARKLLYIPNFVDTGWLDRPKLPDARFALGFVGMEWSRKRFDRALDLLAAVRRQDPRYRLLVRSAMPWHNEFAWVRPGEREHAAACFARLERDPLLRDAVIFHPPGQDMARWYRHVGHLLSTSDEEGSHASVAEAMASGSVPVVHPWPGADEIYDKQWVHTSTSAAAAAVLDSADPAVWRERADAARAEVRRTHDPEAVVAAWADLLHGDLDGARGHFDTLVGPAC